MINKPYVVINELPVTNKENWFKLDDDNIFTFYYYNIKSIGRESIFYHKQHENRKDIIYHLYRRNVPSFTPNEEGIEINYT